MRPTHRATTVAQQVPGEENADSNEKIVAMSTFQNGDKVRVGKTPGRITGPHGQDCWWVNGQQHPIHYRDIKFA